MTHACGVRNTEKYSVCKSVKLASSVCLLLGNAEMGSVKRSNHFTQYKLFNNKNGTYV